MIQDFILSSNGRKSPLGFKVFLRYHHTCGEKGEGIKVLSLFLSLASHILFLSLSSLSPLFLLICSLSQIPLSLFRYILSLSLSSFVFYFCNSLLASDDMNSLLLFPARTLTRIKSSLKADDVKSRRKMRERKKNERERERERGKSINTPLRDQSVFFCVWFCCCCRCFCVKSCCCCWHRNIIAFAEVVNNNGNGDANGQDKLQWNKILYFLFSLTST